MPLEAEVHSVSKPGGSINVLVIFRDSGAEVSRETLVFFPHEKLNEDVLKARIDEVGDKLNIQSDSEVFARAVIGRRFQVTPLPNIISAGLRAN